jgi:hypothetical protein
MREEARRLALVRLQGMMAGLARREAMRALSEALNEERRRSALAERSAALVAAAALRRGSTSAAALADRVRFASGIARIAGDAQAARGDALRQAEWQASTLAAAEARAKRIAEIEEAAVRVLDAAREARDTAVPAALARKLHSHLSGQLNDRSKG